MIEFEKPNNKLKIEARLIISSFSFKEVFARPAKVKGVAAEGVRRKTTWADKIRFVRLSHLRSAIIIQTGFEVYNSSLVVGNYCFLRCITLDANIGCFVLLSVFPKGAFTRIFSLC